MKKFSAYVDEKVFSANKRIVDLQNKTKELFFKCLNNGEDEAYFKEQLEKIWGKEDYSFMQDDIEEYIEMIHTNNIEEAKKYIQVEDTEEVNKRESSAIYLLALELIKTQVNRYKSVINREYERARTSPVYQEVKQEYLKKKVQKYNSQTVPYYSKETGEVIREVQLSTYVAMIENTNLTRSAWNRTLNDAEVVNNTQFYIPYHNFSCEDCRAHQGRILSRQDVLDYIGIEEHEGYLLHTKGIEEEYEGDLLHPNCKCTLLIYWGGNIRTSLPYSDEELNKQYEIRQRVNSLTLKKSELLTDRRIQKELGNMDQVDEVNKKLRAINSKIKDYQAELPTEELKKQVTAINR